MEKECANAVSRLIDRGAIAGGEERVYILFMLSTFKHFVPHSSPIFPPLVSPPPPPPCLPRCLAQQSRFQQMSEAIIGRIDEMGTRIDDLEHSIGDLMAQAGIDEAAEGDAAPEGAGKLEQ